MTVLQQLLLRLATSKKGRKIIGAILALILGAILLFCMAIGALIVAIASLGKGNELYYPLINSTRIVEPYDPDRIIIHRYTVEVEKEIAVQVEVKKPVLDKNGKPVLGPDGKPLYKTVLEWQTETIIVTEEREEKIESPHLGVDFSAREGSYVVACCGGTVTNIYTDEVEGTVVCIDHEEAGVITQYLHLENIIVNVGDELIMGQPIGRVGLSGECTPYRESTANVHLQILKNGKLTDPAPFLQKWGQYLDIPTALIKEQAGTDWEAWMTSEIEPDDIVWNGEDYMWPVPGYGGLSSSYGWRDMDGDGELDEFHTGLDIPAPAGTPIYAAAPGVVSTQGHWSYGTCVKVSVDGQTVNIYAHMQARAEGIIDGVSVVAGQLLGYVGSTGNSTGNHLHFQVNVNGSATNPSAYFP